MFYEIDPPDQLQSYLNAKPSGESSLEAENCNASKPNVSEWTATVRVKTSSSVIYLIPK